VQSCSVIKNLRIVRGGFEDYKKLARFHYRDSRPGAYTAIFVIKPDRGVSKEPVGVIVYTMPSAGAEMRNVATGNAFAGFDNRTLLALINKNIRRISRVVIETRFRGLGLASRLVRETMPEMGVPIVEAMAVMGMVNPFFEKAGMKAYAAKMPVRCVKLIEAFSAVGIEEEELIDAEEVQRKVEQLGRREGELIERQIRDFLQSYGQRRYEKNSLERTRFVLSKLTFRPVYYIWFNPKTADGV
jgi:nucleoside diphosphate kinase